MSKDEGASNIACALFLCQTVRAPSVNCLLWLATRGGIKCVMICLLLVTVFLAKVELKEVCNMILATTEGLRKTLPLVFGKKAAIADQFFDKVFLTAPEMRQFFPHNYGRRKELFATFLTQVALGAECDGVMEQVAQQLATRHRTLGVRPEHYRVGNQALAEAFKTTLADRLSAEELRRWIDVFTRFNQRLAELAA
ncbi:globin [Pseudodonghicola xiamenensis]|nr:globin [Pseudodonghicola xiamenensis]